MNHRVDLGDALQRMQGWLRSELIRRQVHFQEQEDIIQRIRTKLWAEITRNDPLPKFQELNAFYLGIAEIPKTELDRQLRNLSKMEWQISDHFGRRASRIKLMLMPNDADTLRSITSRQSDLKSCDSLEELGVVCRSERERRVIEMYASDHTSPQIATALGIERTTVNRILKRLASRLIARSN